jgi:mannose-binding lectin 2
LPEKAWQVEFQFAVHGTGSHLYGDGFAFWATSQRTTPGPVFGNQDYFDGIGIFFDTYMNGYVEKYFPYVNVMRGDGKTRYDHDMDGKTNELGGCEVDFRGLDRTTKARVTYYEGALLELELQYREDNSWTKCFSLRGIRLPKPAYLGFSAMTGEVTDNHDIIYVSTHEITSKPPVEAMPSQNYGTHAMHSEGMGWFLKFVLFAGICGVAFVGYRMFQQQNNKRF